MTSPGGCGVGMLNKMVTTPATPEQELANHRNRIVQQENRVPTPKTNNYHTSVDSFDRIHSSFLFFGEGGDTV